MGGPRKGGWGSQLKINRVKRGSRFLVGIMCESERGDGRQARLPYVYPHLVGTDISKDIVAGCSLRC